MTKADLINTVAKVAKVSKRAAEEAVNATMDCIARGIKKDRRLQVPGFGTFSVSRRRAGPGKNPRTGETIKIPAAKVAKFKAGNLLKSEVK